MSCEIQPARHNHQPPTNRAPNEPAMPIIYVPKKAYFGQKLAVFGPKILIFTGGSKAPCSHCFFGRAWDEMGNKCQYLAQNDQKWIFWTNFGRFWAKNPNFYGSK